MAGFNIAGFRAEGLRQGGARPTLFTVNLTFPSVIQAEFPGVSNRVQFLASAAQLPESNLGEIEVGYFGRKIKVAGDRDFPDWSIKVINDEDFQIRDALEAWHNAINTIISNRLDPAVANIEPAFGNSYKTIATVTQFSKVGPGDIDGDGAIKTYRFDGIFPRRVGAIEVNWDAQNRIEEFDVMFSYDWYEPLRRANDVPIFPTELNPA